MKRLFLSLALALGIFAIPIPSFATVSSTANTVQYSGDGHSTSFSFNNNVYLASDLNVYEVTAGVSTLLTLNTNYSVSLTAISGVTGAYTATINLAGGSSPAGALAVGTTLVIVRNIPYTQLINISDYSSTPAATWNQAHDRGVILSQQLLNLVNRSILQSITATTPITFPPPVSSNIIGWDVTGTILQNYVPNTATYIALPLSIAQGGTGSTSANLALTALGGATSGANSNITSLSGITTPLSQVQGGTGSSVLMATSGSPAITVGTGLSFTGGTLSNTGVTAGFGAWSVTGSGGCDGFGSTGCQPNTTYGPSPTDGTMYMTGYSNGSLNAKCITDSSSSPSISRGTFGNTVSGTYGNCSANVRKGDYFSFTETGLTNGAYYFISSGT